MSVYASGEQASWRDGCPYHGTEQRASVQKAGTRPASGRQAFSQCTQIAAGRRARAPEATPPPAQLHCGSVIAIDSPTVRDPAPHQCSVHIKPHSRITCLHAILPWPSYASYRPVPGRCPVPSSSTDPAVLPLSLCSAFDRAGNIILALARFCITLGASVRRGTHPPAADMHRRRSEQVVATTTDRAGGRAGRASC